MDIARCALLLAWINVLAGFVTGAWMGMRFADPGFAGGYGSWRRRLLRLGHIACFGTAFLLLLLAAGAGLLAAGSWAALIALAIGAWTMPAVCFLAAWRQPWRHAFPLPVLALLTGAILALWELVSWTSP